jgi:hypothetical protein
MMGKADIVICSKSTWEPSIRREHAIARLAVDAGHRVVFIERPQDVRAALDAPGQWMRHVVRPRIMHADGVLVITHAVAAPGHRDALSERLAALALGRTITRIRRPGVATVLVAMAPWQWPALEAAPGVRRAFDSTDDWRALLPHRAGRIEELMRRIGTRADAVTLVSAELREAFLPAQGVVVPNGVSRELLVPLTAPPGTGRLVYAGTLSERFDGVLVSELLRRLPDWTIDLFGQCQYPGRGDEPGEDLQDLLDGFDGRARWHGVVERRDLAAALDAADVAILPNRPEHSAGQDAMKLYDYAARGRPIVTTRWNDELETTGPPGLVIADDAAAFADGVLAAAASTRARADEQRRWAEARRWETRWPAWSAAVLGETVST